MLKTLRNISMHVVLNSEVNTAYFGRINTATRSTGNRSSKTVPIGRRIFNKKKRISQHKVNTRNKNRSVVSLSLELKWHKEV